MKKIVISRHEGALDWLEKRLGDITPLAHFSEEDIEALEAEDQVFGNLPLPLIDTILKKGAEFYLLSLPKIAFSERGKELTPEEMGEVGAKLIRVRHLKLEEVGE